MAELEDPSSMAVDNTATGEASVSSSAFENASDEQQPPAKKKRNLPGMPGTFKFCNRIE